MDDINQECSTSKEWHVPTNRGRGPWVRGPTSNSRQHNDERMDHEMTYHHPATNTATTSSSTTTTATTTRRTTTKIHTTTTRPRIRSGNSEVQRPSDSSSRPASIYVQSILGSSTSLMILLTISLLVSVCVAAPIQENITLSIKDGFIPYKIGNNETLRNDLKNAFFSLQGAPLEARLPLDDTPKPAVPTQRRNRQRHHRRRKNDGQKRKVFNGRHDALMALADPDGLKMEQKCNGQKFKQRVKAGNCLTKVVYNRLCHGTCASYFIPRMHSKKLKASFKSCATCAPYTYDFIDVTLDCPGQNPPHVTKKIVMVKECRCREIDVPLF